ncbi:MAG: aminopeptidase [Desulfurococcales archaeon]|nr:aminopeptidase [Desulfurococcales archaeon]
MDRDVLVSRISEAMVSCIDPPPSDGILVIYDGGSSNVASVIVDAAKALGVESHQVDLDTYGRPLERVPQGLQDLLEGTRFDASFYVAGVKPGELSFRSKLIEAPTGKGASHVHMPKATMDILSKVRDCGSIRKVIHDIHQALKDASKVRVTSKAGTDVTLEVGSYRWVVDDGVIPRGEWGNWPPGEVYTTPSNAEGVIVVDGVIGDYFSMKYGLLRERVMIEVSRGRVERVEGGRIAAELEEYLAAHDCGLMVGELGIGGNPYIERPIGNMLHDEKMPGAHIAFGDP